MFSRSPRLKTLTGTLAGLVATLWASPLLTQEHAPAVHAADDKAGVLPSVAQGIVPMIVSLLVFVIVLAILSKFVFPKINKGLQDRSDKIREEIESAEQARLQAKDALEQYQQSLAQARAEAQKMLEQAKAQTLALSADLKAKAEVELGHLRERATRDIETAKRAALNEIYAEAAGLATHAAAKILRREIRPADNQAIVDESLRQLQSTGS